MTAQPTAEAKLPYRVLTKAAEMFGGSTGFSHRQMDEFFLHVIDKHADEVGIVEGSNRSDVFKSWLLRFPVPEQKRLLFQLCREEYPMYHGPPSKKDRDELATLLWETPVTVLSRGVKIDGQFIAETWRKALERMFTPTAKPDFRAKLLKFK